MERKLFEKEIKGLRIRVNGVPSSATGMYFEVGEGEKRTSVAEYFTERYGTLQFPKFPVLHVGSKRNGPTRMRMIQTLARDAAFDKDPWLKAFGIQVDMRMVSLDGRVLVPPKIQYGAGSRQGGVVVPRDGQWRYEQEKFYVPANAGAYGLLVIGQSEC